MYIGIKHLEICSMQLSPITIKLSAWINFTITCCADAPLCSVIDETPHQLNPVFFRHNQIIITFPQYGEVPLEKFDAHHFF